jgi:hypothetical protein
VTPMVMAMVLNVVFIVVLLFSFEFLFRGTGRRKARARPMIGEEVSVAGKCGSKRRLWASDGSREGSGGLRKEQKR